MAALTDLQLAVLHVHLGTAADEDDLQDRYDRLNDVTAVIREVLTQRLADYTATPASFSIPGEYQQGTGENIKALQAQLASLDTVETAGASVVRIVPTGERARR